MNDHCDGDVGCDGTRDAMANIVMGALDVMLLDVGCDGADIPGLMMRMRSRSA